MSDLPFRVLPRLSERNRHFWQSGERGELCFLYCDECAHYVHPPQPLCPGCLGKALAPRAVSGRARVLTFTLNHQPWVPSPDHPYCIAIVEIDEQPGLRLMTNIVNCPAEEVSIDMPVRVLFEHHDDVWIPVFEPVEPA